MISILGAGLFITIWWTLIFAVLPFGIRSQAEQGEVVAGSEPGAPVTVRLLRVVAITTGLSIMVWLGVFGAIHFQLIDIDRWAKVLLG